MNKARFIRRISAVSNSIQLSAAEMRLWIKLNSTEIRQKFDV